MQRAHLIANTKSGKGQGEALPEMAHRVAKELGVELVHHDTRDATQFDQQIKNAVAAAKADGGTVIAAGGDGTIRSVAQHAAEAGVPFGVVACGTFNFFARSHHIPEDLEEAFRLALTGDIRDVRLGFINGQYFLINANLGLYARSIRERESSIKRFGRDRLVVILSTMKSLLSRHRHFDVHLDTPTKRTHVKTMSIFIGNNALQLRNLSVNVARCMKHELLAAVVLKPVSRWDMLRIFFRGIAKTLENEERLDMFCVNTLTIKLKKRKTLVALDGEMFTMTSPLEIESRPGALRMRLPPKIAT